MVQVKNTLDLLHGRFAAQVTVSPDSVAVEFSDTKLTYRELDDRASTIARWLCSASGTQGLRGQRIGIYMDKSVEFVVAMLAVLKAGAAYVPIDPRYPDERVSYLLQDSNVTCILTRRVDISAIISNYSLFFVDEVESDVSSNGLPEVLCTDPAYVIYTSGSTGQPKGTVIEHGNVIALFDATESLFDPGPTDVWSQFHSTSFDFSVWEMWGALLYGGRLIIVPASVAEDATQFARFVARTGVTVLSQTPTAFQYFTRTAADSDMTFPRLRYVVFGGERLEVSHYRRWMQHYGDQRPILVNMYGITETTVHVTHRVMKLHDLEKPELSPIGVPLSHLKIHLLNSDGSEVGNGEPGEIFVTGRGVACGYLNRTELTRERFPEIDLELNTSSIRSYRTGDLAYRMAGELFYLGRVDDQVKVRGYRIELREVENQIEQVKGVESCVVAAQDMGEGDKRLVAFIVADKLRADIVRIVMSEISQRLPAHMIPSRVFEVSSIPRTSNGKCDRSELLRKMEKLTESGGQVALNKSKSSVGEIAEIASEMLGDQGLSWDEDLFDQGATSLSLSRIILEINARYGVRIMGSDLAGDCSILNITTVTNRARKSSDVEVELMQ